MPRIDRRAIGLACILAGCQRPASPAPDREPSPKPDTSRPAAAPEDESRAVERLRERAERARGPATRTVDSDDTQALRHKVVYADRTSHGYLIIVPGQRPPPTFSREQLRARVVAGELKALNALPDDHRRALLTLLAREPRDTRMQPAEPGAGTLQPARAPEEYPELLGLHVDRVEVPPTAESLVSQEVRRDPVLIRGLDPEARRVLSEARWAYIVRADYRIDDSVRGLRLLQSLVYALAVDLRGLVHDADTLETFDPQTFSSRRYLGRPSNVADQIAVLPFVDRSDQSVRLVTRGMRRFGIVDLELSGLPANPNMLQLASHWVLGTAVRLIEDAGVDESGFALEVAAQLEVRREHMAAAYGPRADQLPECNACPGSVRVHLVERETATTDAIEHVVAQIVAPQAQSDAAGYDHGQWTRRGLLALFGAGG